MKLRKGGETVNERMKELRKSLCLSQEDFGKLIGLKKSGVCAIEAGTRRVTEKHLKMLQQSGYSINTNWILTGEGDMFLEVDKNEQIRRFVETILEKEPNDFRKRLITGLYNLPPEGWTALEKLLDTLKF